MKQATILVMTALMLVNTSMAVEKYYSLDLNYYDGVITYRSINLLTGEKPEMPNEGRFTLRAISFYNAVLDELRFDINAEEYFGIKENKDFTLYVPYYKEGEEIVIFKDGERIFGYDVSSFADVCGDGSCQFHESYEDCPGDCPSGLRDDFCDMVEDKKCDPDCSLKMDTDCEEEFVVETKEPEKESEIKEESVKAEGRVKEDKISLMYYIIPSLFVILIIFGLSILSRNKTRKQNKKILRDYVDDNLKKGYAPKQIKEVLLNQGYKEKEVDNLFKEFEEVERG